MKPHLSSHNSKTQRLSLRRNMMTLLFIWTSVYNFFLNTPTHSSVENLPLRWFSGIQLSLVVIITTAVLVATTYWGTSSAPDSTVCTTPLHLHNHHVGGHFTNEKPLRLSEVKGTLVSWADSGRAVGRMPPGWKLFSNQQVHPLWPDSLGSTKLEPEVNLTPKGITVSSHMLIWSILGKS